MEDVFGQTLGIFDEIDPGEVPALIELFVEQGHRPDPPLGFLQGLLEPDVTDLGRLQVQQA